MKNTRKILTVLLSCAALGTVSACASGDGKPVPTLDFNYLQSYSVNVGTVDVVNSYADHKATADYGAEFVVTPDDAMEKYLRARYKPQGGQGRLLLNVEEGSVFVFHDDSTVAPARWIGVAGFDEYSMTIKVTARAENVPGFYEQTKTITARRRVKISEHASIAEREQDQFAAIEMMMHEIDDQLHKTLKDEFRLVP